MLKRKPKPKKKKILIIRKKQLAEKGDEVV